MRTHGFWQRLAGYGLAVAAFTLLVPASARAQYTAPDLTTGAIGEKYHFEVSGILWNPSPGGLFSSEQWQVIGSDIDIVKDLGYETTRFKDLRVVLRPSKKSKFRFQYTPIRYEASTILKRDLIFNGIKFPVQVPIESEFVWKVMRFGYEYDFIYRDRGFVGMLLDVRYTQFDAEISTASSLLNERQFTSAKAPLPALGMIGRGYVLPNLAINFEVSGLTLPRINGDYEASYFDWDLNGTFNVTNNVGIQVGWRKLSNFLRIENDLGDLKFQGMWFGAAIRY